MEADNFQQERVLLLNPSNQGLRVSFTKYRWVILAIFALFSFIQSAIWDTWGPISSSASVALGFTDHDFELLSNWLSIGGLPTIPIFIWIINSKGARLPVLIGTVLVAVGTGLRCLPLAIDAHKIFIHAGQLLGAIAACPVIGTSALISNVWFPPDERITATSSMVLLGNLGNAFSYLVGPAIVDPPNLCNASTTISTYTINPPSILLTSSVRTETTTACYNNEEEMREQIQTLLYMEFAIAVLTLLLTIFLFKNKPKRAPSASAAAERLQLLPALKMPWKKKQFWVAIVALSLVCGAYYGWYGIITLLVSPHRVSQNEVGQATFTMTVVGAFAGIAIGWLSDRLKGYLKWMLLAIICTMFIVFLYIMIILLNWIDAAPFRFTKVGFWISLLLYGCASNAMQPLTLEFLADIAFPVQEGMSSSIFAWFMMWSSFAFLTTLNSIGNPAVANYLVIGFTGLAIPLLGIFTLNQNNRLRVDEYGDQPKQEEEANIQN